MAISLEKLFLQLQSENKRDHEKILEKIEGLNQIVGPLQSKVKLLMKIVYGMGGVMALVVGKLLMNAIQGLHP